ncbi:MAG: outer membrane beta-barrel protein [Cyclobacteriaceae bacterium]
MNRISTSMPRIGSIALIGLLFAASVLHAQVDMGVLGGLNLDRFRVTRDPIFDIPPTKTGPGFHFALFVGLPISEIISIRGEVQQNRRAFRFEGAPNNLDWNYDYLDFPLLVSFKLRTKVQFDLGPSLAVNHNWLRKRDGNTWHGKDQLFAVGGVRYSLTDKWEIMGRYWYGVTPLDEFQFNNGPGPNNLISQPKIFHQTLQFSMGYKLLPRRQT